MTRIASAASPTFDGLKPFPAGDMPPQIGHNNPPPEEAIIIDFREKLAERPGFMEKVDQIIAKSRDLPECKDADVAGRLGDFMKMAKAAIDHVSDCHAHVKRPFLAATRAVDAAKNGLVDDLEGARARARRLLDVYTAEQARLQREEQARIEAELERRRREAEAAAAAAGVDAEPEFVPVAAPPPSAPIARGDLGARVGTRTVWRHEPVTSAKGLPAAILNHPKVLEAINAVIAAQVRSGIREIKGVIIAEHTETSVR